MRSTVNRGATYMIRCLLAVVLGTVSSQGLADVHRGERPELALASWSKAVSDFYANRAGAPLWFGAGSNDGEAAKKFLTLLGTASLDGVAVDERKIGLLLMALRAASSGDQSAIARAEHQFSEAFISYAHSMQKDPKVGVNYVHPALRPSPTPASELLGEAARAPSLSQYITELSWMNPLYGRLRQAAINGEMTDEDRYILALNLQRARAIPRVQGRFLLVNTANQMLHMYDGGKVVGSMKIIAGRPTAQTPLLNGYLTHAVLNPFWHVPADLAARLALNVVREGVSYLKANGYEVVSGFGENPDIIDPTRIDWRAVAEGSKSVQMRQLPSKINSMGRVKFMFPNSQGVWLHDTPARNLFSQSVRLQSAGCIRLEKAWELGKWLNGGALTSTSEKPEQRVDLPEPVPIFITYLTTVPSEPGIEFINDVYRRNPARTPETASTAQKSRVGAVM